MSIEETTPLATESQPTPPAQESSLEAEASSIEAQIGEVGREILASPDLSETDRREAVKILTAAEKLPVEMPDYPTTTIEVAGKTVEVIVTGKKMPQNPDGSIDQSAEIGFEHLVAIRETEYHPVKDENGEWYIPTPYGATKDNPDPRKVEPRFTSHYALNHIVRENQGRQNLDSGFIVFSPMKGLIERNGDPASMDPVDTYFRGERVYLPIGSVILELKNGELPVDVEKMITAMGYSALEADKYRVDHSAEALITKLADDNGIDVVDHMRSPDGIIEGSIYGLCKGDSFFTKALEVVISRYDQPGYEFYQPIIVEGLKRYQNTLNGLQALSDEDKKTQNEMISVFLAEISQ